MSRNAFICLTMVVAAALLNTSCDDTTTDIDRLFGEPTDVVCFGVTSEAYNSVDGSTRAAMLEQKDINAFNVLCTASGNGSKHLFFNEEYTCGNDGVFNSNSKNHYWPGDAWTLNFYAAVNATVDSESLSISYTVPSDISSQVDLLVASATNVAGDSNRAVALNFKHICTSVQFSVYKIPDGYSIKSARLVNVGGSGTYSFADDSWTLNGSTTDFELSGLSVTNGDITSTTNCFMMLPQSFDEESSAVLEIVIGNGKDEETFKASLAGKEWSKGKVAKYAISIGYNLELTDVPENVDAHYVISMVGLNVKFLGGKEWTLTADNDASLIFADDANAKLKEGYWTDCYADGSSARGSSTLTGDANDSGKSIYVLIPENNGSANRNVTLTLSVGDDTIKQYTISQYYPNNGWEQIDDGAAEFGFYWDRVVNYTADSKKIESFKDIITSYEDFCNSYISDEESVYAKTLIESWKETIWFVTYSKSVYYININYSKYTNIKTSSSDGYTNTITLKDSVNNMSTTCELEETLKTASYFSLSGVIDNGTDLSPTGTNNITSPAIEMCLKKNCCNLDSNGEVVFEDISWYIPAVNEFSGCPSTPSYCWSSTVDSSGSTNAYNGAGESVSRTSRLSIFTKRKIELG